MAQLNPACRASDVARERLLRDPRLEASRVREGDDGCHGPVVITKRPEVFRAPRTKRCYGGGDNARRCGYPMETSRYPLLGSRDPKSLQTAFGGLRTCAPLFAGLSPAKSWVSRMFGAVWSDGAYRDRTGDLRLAKP